MREWDTKDIAYGPPSRADRNLATSLSDDGEARRLALDWMYDGQLRIRSKSWVGVVRLEQAEIRIHPKLAGEDAGLLHMLDYASGVGALRRLHGLRPLATGGRNILDLICLLLVEEAEGVIRAGVLSDYVVREEALATLRGRLLIEQQVAQHYGEVTPLECRHDEWEADIVENRLVAAGLAAARRLCRDRPLRSRVARTAAAFEEVCVPDPAEDIVRLGRDIPYQRRNSHYQAAHQWSLLLLENQGVTHLYAPGNASCFAFLFDMNALFERFVARVLEEACAGSELRVERQTMARSVIVEPNGRSYTSVRPDLLIRDHSCTPPRTHVMDTKYKLYDEKRLDIGDIYQAFVYAYAFDRSTAENDCTATLLYPSARSHERQRLLIESQDGVQGATIRAVGIDLDALVNNVAAGEAPAADVVQMILGSTALAAPR